MKPPFSLSRRHFLAGSAGAAGGLLIGGGAASQPASAQLRKLLDSVAGLPSRAEMLRVLKNADPARLTRADRVVLVMIVRGIASEERLRSAFPFGKPDGSSPFVVSQRHGAWLEAPGEGNPAVLMRRFDDESEQLRADAAHGIMPPAFMLDAVIEGLHSRLSSAAAPAIGRQIAVLESLRTKAPAEPGIWWLPNGPEYYRLRLRCTTGSDIAPVALGHDANQQVAALIGRADALLKGLGLSRGSVGARLRALKQRPEYRYTNDDAGRSRAVADMNRALDRLRPHLPAWFNPPFEPGSSVKRMSGADESASRRGYRDPPTTAGPGAYYPDLANVRERPAWTLTTVAYHETIPGHLIQLRRQAIADPHPLQIRYAAGYSEGWAIYAENLADRMGLLSPIEQIGFVQSLLFRLSRLVIDIGMHVHRWDRARALRHLDETVGFELFFPFATEVDRAAAEPGGFAGDGMMAMALKDMTPPLSEARAFHDHILNQGPLSLEALLQMG